MLPVLGLQLIIFENATTTDISPVLPADGHTIHGWILKRFKHPQETSNQLLFAIQIPVHFTLDLLTFSNDSVFLSFIGHWFDHKGQVQSTVLALHRF